MVLFPCCKINIGLDILSRRADGFHNIETLMFPVRGLCDSVEITPCGGVEFSSSGLVVDCPPEKNLCLRAYEIIKEEFGLPPVHIHLHKAVPFGAGLGGGSADAAYVIRGLNELFSLALDTEKMRSLAARLGSDTAFFITSEPAMSTGRGETLTHYNTGKLSGLHLVVVKPDVGVSTAAAYSGVTPHTPGTPLPQRLAGDISSWNETIVNDFEQSVFARLPLLAQIKTEIYQTGALYASMSGSGSALYGIFDSKPTIPQSLAKHFVYQEVIL